MPTLTTKRQALLERLVIDGGLTAADDLTYVEACDAAEWLSTAGERIDAATAALDEGVGELSHADLKRLNTLLIRTLSPMTADDLLELRDLIRSTLIDAARRQMVEALEESCDFDYAADRRRHEVETYDAAFARIAAGVRP